MLANLYRQVQPAHIITEGRSPDTFLTCLTNLIKEDYSGTFDSNATQQNDQIVQSKLSFLPKKEYSKYLISHITLISTVHFST